MVTLPITRDNLSLHTPPKATSPSFSADCDLFQSSHSLLTLLSLQRRTTTTTLFFFFLFFLLTTATTTKWRRAEEQVLCFGGGGRGLEKSQKAEQAKSQQEEAEASCGFFSNISDISLVRLVLPSPKVTSEITKFPSLSFNYVDLIPHIRKK